MSVDEVPIIGHSTRWSNLLLAIAHAYSASACRRRPATGELVASMLAGTASPIDATPYAPARFHL